VPAELDHRIKLPVFEGPLDLLLFLIRKHEIDIYDIPISQVLRQYLDILYAMEELHLEVAGDFFVMAATLMEIKSRLLLPKHEQAVDPDAEEDELDPRWELVHQLLQYKKFKDAAENLDDLATSQSNMISLDQQRVSNFDLELRPLKNIDEVNLWNTFNNVLRRLAEKLVVGDINDDQTTVVDQMEMIIEKTENSQNFTFSSLFSGPTNIRVLIVTFLAVLELVRMKRIAISQTASFSDIDCKAISQNRLESTET
jgi:segregation and condensation protein A